MQIPIFSTSLSCNYLDVSPNTARILSMTANAVMNYSVSRDFSTTFIETAAYTGASLLGSFFGSKLAFFAKKGVDKLGEYYTKRNIHTPTFRGDSH